jgi:hypothetical protein
MGRAYASGCAACGHGIGVHLLLISAGGCDYDSYQAAAFFNGRTRIAKNASIARQQATTILVRMQADLMATLKANTRALVAALRAARIVPIFVTVPPPRSSFTAATALQKKKTAGMKKWLIACCALVGARCIDTPLLITNPVDANWKDYFAVVPDIHALPRTNVLVGKFVADALSSYYLPTPPYWAASNVDPMNAMPNGLFLSVNGNLPTGWMIEDGNPSAVSTVAPVVGIRGNSLTITGAALSDIAVYSSPKIQGLSLGDRLAVSFRYKSAGLADVGRFFGIGIRQNAGTYSWQRRLFLESDTPEGTAPLIYFEVSVLGGASNVFQIGTGTSGTAGAIAPAVTIGELTVVNLTTGQLLAP